MPHGLEGLLAGHTLVKRYRIEDVVGRGGFAVVYHATDTRLGRPVAVKVITLTAEDPAQREVLRERLHREARAAASLPHHPNLVTVHDVGTDPQLGLDFLVMELLRGENLAQALQRGRPPLSRALRILRDAADGLAVGHRAGLVHRDVKPGNIFLAAPHDGADPEAFRVCLLDYGIALAIEDDQTVTRGIGANPLSPAFAAPEQLRGDRDLSPAADVFSLGVVGYQLLTGERPFATEAGRMPEAWTVRAPLRSLSPEVPPAVEDVVMRAMALDPRDRFVDADAFAEALDAATGADGVPRTLAAKAHNPGLGALPPDEDAEDDRTMLAPPVVPAAAGARGAASGAAGHRPVPPLRPPLHATPRRGSRLPIVLIVALLLAGAAAWAAMRGMGGPSRADASLASDSLPVVETAGEAPDAAAGTAGVPVIPPRTAEEVSNPAAAGGTGASAASSPSAPAATPPPQDGRRPAPTRPNAPAGEAQPAVPPVSQPEDPPPAVRPPAQQPPAEQPPAQPPAQPEPQQPRPEPPVLGRPVEREPEPQPRPAPPANAPRDTIRIGNPP